jgi:branched-chain amino acid transport system permease protein
MGIEVHLFMNIMNGLVWGLIVALIALGLVLVFGLIRILNIAHGEFYMLGAVIGWYLIQYSQNFWLALILAPLLVGALGLVIERAVVRTVEDKPIKTLIVTLGISLILQYTVYWIYGGSPQRIIEPFQFQVTLFGAGYSGYRFFVAFFASIVIGLLALFLKKTRIGLWIRAVKQDQQMAAAVGIPTKMVIMITFGLGSFLAALGGILSAPILSVDFLMGLEILPTAFMVVIIGGPGNLVGAVGASILIAELEGISSVFVSPTLARVLSLVFMSVVLLKRPDGIFSRGRR